MEVLFLVYLLPILIILIIHIHKTKSTRRASSTPPGPKPFPLIGNLHQLDPSSPHHSLWQLSKHYGPIMSLKLGYIPTLVVSSAKMAEQVLKTHDLKFASRPSFLGFRKLSYNGLDLACAPYSPYWREMRKLCVHHLFSSQRAHSFRPVRENEVAQLIQKLSQYGGDEKGANLSEILMSLTNTIICKIAFGKTYVCDYEEGVELGSGQRRSRLQVLLNEAQALLAEFYFSDNFPLFGWIDRVKGTLGRLDKTFKELDLIYQRVIDDHMDYSARPKTKEQEVDDIIDILLQMMNDHSLSFDLTLDHIKAVLMNIFIAGTDTSSAAVVWAMTALMNNPRVMNKVQMEIRNLYEDKDFINEDDIEKLPYLKSVVKETLRLFPPSPLLLPRETIESCNIDGYEIKPKTLVYVNAWAIARDPENWNDPEEFYPERFIISSVDFKGKNFELIPFGSGRRMCPAMNMGVVTVELTLANLLHSFDWKLPHGFDKEQVLDTQVKPGITMHKKIDLYLVPKKRKP
ncbi:cytochrome P450 71B37 [Medicago truncatula]|uniref:Cytochrome P450 family 71 protein n=2 Tax=Medicago truncatula TaxID=3880 RepID=G7I6G7_MEDTR|nr:cytochrome P450 71B37 [Medicago truncatula]AES59644.1 cytochrome P450 family 71 protein [Medicago truncatula]